MAVRFRVPISRASKVGQCRTRSPQAIAPSGARVGTGYPRDLLEGVLSEERGEDLWRHACRAPYSEEVAGIVKIAVATDGHMVASHFGRCPEYTIVTVDDNGNVANKVVIPNPGHEPGFLPEYLSKLGVSCIIAGGMGPRAQGLFAEKNIRTVTGASGLVSDVVASYLAGSLELGESQCEHGAHPGGCDRHDEPRA